MSRSFAALLGLFLLAAEPALAQGCSPVDDHLVDPAGAAGRKGWIFEDTGAIWRREPRHWTSATTAREVAPGKFANDPPSLGYGLPVTIVAYDREHSMYGEYIVRLADGSTRRVEKRVVKLHEFWRCRPEVLLDATRDRGMHRLDRRLTNTVWATMRNPKARGLEEWGAWIPDGELGRMSFLICDSYLPAKPGDEASLYDVRCRGFEPGRHRGKSYQIRHEDLETVSPVAMRMLFES